MTTLKKVGAPAPAQLISSGPAGTTVGALLPSGVGQQGPPGEQGPQGIQGEQGPPGGSILSGWWDYSIAMTAPPLSGQIRTSPATTIVGQPMTIYLSTTDDEGLYWTGVSPAPGDEIELRGTAGAVQRITITTAELTVPGPSGYITFVGTVKSANQEIAKTARVLVSLIRAPAPPSNVMQFATAVLTPAQILALHTTPVIVAPAIAGKVLGVTGFGWAFKYGGTIYGGPNISTLKTGWGTTIAEINATGAAPWFGAAVNGALQRTSDGYEFTQMAAFGVQATGYRVVSAAQVLGKAVSIFNSGAAYTLGNGSLTIYTNYIIMDGV